MTTTTKTLQSVVELPTYRSRVASRIPSKKEQADAIDMIAADPECGPLMPFGGGIRKVRFGVEGRGKRGGVRIVYYWHDRENPIFLITVFGKNEQENLSRAEINALAKLVKRLIETYRGPKDGE